MTWGLPSIKYEEFTWNNNILYKLLLFDKCTWNHLTLYKLFVLRIVTWIYNRLQMFIISYLKV